MYLYKLFIYIFLIATAVNALAIEPQSSDISSQQRSRKTRDIDQIIPCGYCCLPLKKNYCLLFYRVCNTEVFNKAKIVFTTSDFNNQTIFHTIENNIDIYKDKTIIVVIDKNIYFTKPHYLELKKEIIGNLNHLLPYIRSGKQIYIKNIAVMEKTLDSAKLINRLIKYKSPSDKYMQKRITFYKTDYNVMFDLFKNYISLIDSDLKSKFIIYNKNTKEFCGIISDIVVKEHPTTKDSIGNTKNTKNIRSNPATFSYTIAPYTASDKTFNNFPIIIATSIALPVLIGAFVGYFIYKKYKKKSTENNKEIETQNIEKSNEHLYDEIYDIPIKTERLDNENLYQPYNSSPQQKPTISDDHTYITCINSDSNNSLTSKSNKSDEVENNTEQTTDDNTTDDSINTIKIEDAVEGSHIYNVLEDQEDENIEAYYKNIVANTP